MEQTRIKLNVKGLTSSQVRTGAFALVLVEDGLRCLPVIVGMFEAQSIALALEGINPPRPLTHDLFLNYMKATGYRIQEVVISNFNDGVFFSDIILSKGDSTVKIDSRTSDAVAIAIRTRCNIFTTEAIMKKCGIVLEESSQTKNENDQRPADHTADDLQDVVKLKERLRSLRKQELEERMTKAVEKEYYEFAKIYKDELLRREDKGKKG